jgi:hypothetical protein
VITYNTISLLITGDYLYFDIPLYFLNHPLENYRFPKPAEKVPKRLNHSLLSHQTFTFLKTKKHKYPQLSEGKFVFG